MKYILYFTLMFVLYLCLDPVTSKSEESEIPKGSQQTKTDKSDDSKQNKSELEKPKASDELGKGKLSSELNNSTSDEEEETETVITDNLHNYLNNLGQSIAARIRRADGRYGHYILKDLYKYYNALDEISTLLLHPEDSNYEEGQRLYKLVKEAGGPAHLKIPIDYKFLEKRYKWNDDNQTQDLKEVFEETQFLWDQCVAAAENKREMYTDTKKGRIGNPDELSDIS